MDAQGSCPSQAWRWILETQKRRRPHPHQDPQPARPWLPKEDLQEREGVFRTLQDGSEAVGFQAGEQGVRDLWPKPLPRGPATRGPMVQTGGDPAAAGPKPEQAPGGSRGS